MNKNKKEIILLSIILIVQTVIFVIIGINKSYIHMDEAFSLGLASYNISEIQNNEDFYDNWHNGEYYEDYLSVQEDEAGEFSQVYENQKNDVHPPLYYLFLRIFMGFNIGSFSKWPGIILNIIIFEFITIFMYLILKRLFDGEIKPGLIAFVSAITLASLTNVIYIRMYAFSTLNVLIITYLHMKLYDSEKLNIKLLVFIGLSALIGSLTHYYYLFYLAMLFMIFAIKYIKEKRIKELIAYTLTLCSAGGLSLAIFPYSINHMFFGYRGQGVISKLLDVKGFSSSIFEYFKRINVYTFNCTLIGFIVAIAVMIIYKIIRRKKLVEEKNKYMKIIILPTLFYFILVAVSAPWIELRYIMPICQLIFIVAIYYLEQLLKGVFSNEGINIILLIATVFIIIMPFICKVEPEVLYSNKKEVVSKIKEKHNVPAIYMFDTDYNRFLDDIYLFSILDNSYVAKNIEYNEENIQKILEGRDLTNGILVFINEGQDNDHILDVIVKAIDVEWGEYIDHLNNSDVYYFKPIGVINE